MTWKDIGKKVAEAAPLLGNVLAGPVGGAAGSLIATIFGTEPDPDAVMKKIEQDPQAYLKLKELELNHAAELERLALQAETARLADVQSARSREIEVYELQESGIPTSMRWHGSWSSGSSCSPARSWPFPFRRDRARSCSCSSAVWWPASPRCWAIFSAARSPAWIRPGCSSAVNKEVL